jgi:hypothetical protein
MVCQMREMAEASRELERSKIEVQLKLFTKLMKYQRRTDVYMRMPLLSMKMLG